MVYTPRVHRKSPHRLDLYRLAVQHPEAEVAFLSRAYRHYFPRNEPTRLREDFAGTAAVAGAWVGQSEDHRALAIEKHAPTALWANRYLTRSADRRAGDVHVVVADVLDVATPKVDVVAALNFSAFIYHDRPALLAYLRHARRCLAKRGVLVLDAFGGPGAMRPGTQDRRVQPDGDVIGLAGPFTYTWEQRSFDHLSHRIDCRIHFRGLAGQRGRTRDVIDAFRYDWRLWSLPELLELAAEAGFDRADAWCDARGLGAWDGRYRPARKLPSREDWVAYVVAAKG